MNLLGDFGDKAAEAHEDLKAILDEMRIQTSLLTRLVVQLCEPDLTVRIPAKGKR